MKTPWFQARSSRVGHVLLPEPGGSLGRRKRRPVWWILRGALKIQICCIDTYLTYAIYIYTYMFNITTQIKIKYCKHFFAQFEVRILQTSIFVDVAIDYPHVMVHPCSHGPSYTSYKY